jgi:hypothetical protein
MSAVDSTNETAAAVTQTPLTVPATVAGANEMTAEERAEFERGLQRIENFPRDFAWLMIFVGVLGVALPGIIGFPFLIAGGAVLVPGGRKRLSRWAASKPAPLVRASLKQITRMADDIERRYPTLPRVAS